MGTDGEWTSWGRTDPYFGVFAHEKYRTANLTEEALQEFFQSGIDQVDYILRTARDKLDSSFSPRTVLDFGCGTGRLLMPFAGVAEDVLGLDVSEGMLREAKKNCERFRVTNVSVAKSDDSLSALTGKFDLVHSVIVFQHIPPARGLRLFKGLLEHLGEGGVGAVHITYSDGVARGSHLSAGARGVRRFLGRQKRRITGLVRKADPEMLMHSYSFSEVLLLLQRAGVRNFFAEFTDHGGHLGVYLFFQKARNS